MGLMWFLALSMLYLIILCSLFTFTSNCFPSVQPALCHEDDRSALLLFKQSFVISKFASDDSLSFPKTVSWKQNSDCCSWDGVECDEQTGHVIGLHLSSSQLYGSIGSNSTLFHLLQLQRLNLSDNHFNYSKIPFTIANLSSLSHLDLSSSKFSGEIPREISRLSKLYVLRLCSNYDPYYVSSYSTMSPIYLLQLRLQYFQSMIQNLTHLELLSLSYVNISSPIPNTLTNLSSLQNLNLLNTGVYGEFPIGIFHLPYLKFLDVGSNPDLTGCLPEFHSKFPLQVLVLEGTSFQGTLPASIENLNDLQILEMMFCNFSGSIPSSLSNLTQLTVLDLSFNNFKGNLTSSLSNLTQLEYLSIGGNDITSVNISWIGKLNRLVYLNLNTTNIGSEIPKSFANLTKLYYLNIENNSLVGKIPPWISNFTNLVCLDLSANMLHGTVPHSIFSLEYLSGLALGDNLLEGELEFDMILNLKRLTVLFLSFNNLSIMPTRTSSSNASLPKNIRLLELASCNINELPRFLSDQYQLEVLELSQNKIKDSLPSWLWTKGNLWALSFSNNLLVGEISPLVCNLNSLEYLLLSFNNLSGTLPPCLGTFSKSLHILNVRNNMLSGFIPQAFMKRNALNFIDFSQNDFESQLPKALANCRMLEYLDVSNNHINGSFPFWLGTLPELKVLVLRSNKFSGDISSSRSSMFPKLHIFDISQNDFTGNFPSELIQNWKSMRVSDANKLKYGAMCHFDKELKKCWSVPYAYSFTIHNKGNLMNYEKLQKFYSFVAIDLSSNKLDGKIPDVIGDLKGLVLLNLSNNLLTGSIPSSLGNLSELEALDLSNNSLSGMIPQELAGCTFLEFINVSYNNLSGPIPQSTQFDTFESSSFEGNPGLCRKQLLKKCEDHEASPSATTDDGGDEDSWYPFEYDWKVVVIGYVGGLVFALAMGSTLSLERHVLIWLRRVHLRVQRGH